MDEISLITSSKIPCLEPNHQLYVQLISVGKFTVNPTHHHASLEEQVVYCLCDVSSVHQVVVGVFMFAVSHFQGLNERHHGRYRDLTADKTTANDC